MFYKSLFVGFGILWSTYIAVAQTKNTNFSLSSDYFTGQVMLHDNSILQLTTGKPQGVVLSWNALTNGEKPWQARYNYPDYGVSLIYQDYDNSILGYNISLNGHYNFYFFKRRLMLKLGQGIGYASNPYDKITNPKNVAISTSITSSTLIMLNYSSKRFVFERIKFQGGLLFTHHSIGNLNSPNKGVNTIALNVGLTYDF